MNIEHILKVVEEAMQGRVLLPLEKSRKEEHCISRLTALGSRVHLTLNKTECDHNKII